MFKIFKFVKIKIIIFSKVKQLINSIEIKMNKLIDKYNQLKIENAKFTKE